MARPPQDTELPTKRITTKLSGNELRFIEIIANKLGSSKGNALKICVDFTILLLMLLESEEVLEILKSYYSPKDHKS